MIKVQTLILIFYCSFTGACQMPGNFTQINAITSNNDTDKVTVDEVWAPTAIDECMAKIDVGEPYEFETSFNPFYLRANLDDNSYVDYAVLIKGKNSKTRGVVICKDSKKPFIFGEISRPEVPLTSFENDNFITDQWEIATKEETKNRIIRHTGGQKMSPDAKGESITFLFEGGEGVVIYWDGKAFRVNE